MSRERWIDVVFFLVAGGLALLLTTDSRERAVVVAQPVVLAFAFAFAARSAAAFESDNPVRKPWRLLSLGLLFWLLGEATEAFYLIVLGRPDPFPSVADLFFALAYPWLIVSLFFFLRTYRAADLAGERRSPVLPVAVVMVVVGAVVLAPIARSGAPFVERLVGAAYAGLDLVALVPLLLLLRLTWRLRGGSVWKIWAGVLFGFLLTFLGDLSFAYFQTRAEADIGALAEQLEFLSNVMFLLSYLVIARGVLHQLELLRG
jgi:hypothetical protein